MIIEMKKAFQITVYVFAIIGFLLVAVYLALQLGLTKTGGIIDKQHDYFQNQTPEWINSEEWTVLKAAIVKDKDMINMASRDSGVPSRVIVAVLIVEQLRLFNSEREVFKQVFAPLKILGNQSQFSWGVMGVKQETAREIESRLGKDNHILDFKTDNPDNERFERLTDDKDRYYSYLYAALMIKELEKQWADAGFPIDGKVGVIATLYNIGFQNSKPNANPQVGGAEIDIGSTKYSFGGLAESFYNSRELVDIFVK
jgi:hypothetical protein